MLLGWQGSCIHKGTLAYKPAKSSSAPLSTSFKALSVKQADKQPDRQAAKQAHKQAAKQSGSRKQSASKRRLFSRKPSGSKKQLKSRQQARDASTTTKPKQEPKQPKWQQAALRRKNKAAVEVRRGDFGFRNPPWRLTYDVTAEQLRLADDMNEVVAQVYQISFSIAAVLA